MKSFTNDLIIFKGDEFNAFFYSLVSQDTMEMYYASKRQRFLINQGYSYKVINKLGTLDDEQLYYSRKEEQTELMQKVLAANETAADEEDAPNIRSSGQSQIYRTTGGALSSLSGGDEGLYMEYQKKNKDKIRHPLFKKFVYTKGSK